MGGIELLHVYLGVVILLLWAPALHKRWLRFTSRGLGALGLAILGVAMFPLLLIWGDPDPQSGVVESPGKNVARLSYQAGFLGRDSTVVTVKYAGCCQRSEVFWHFGSSGFADPTLEWLDDRHLRITYHTRPGDPQECKNDAGRVEVACVPMDWSEVSPEAR